ncbi:MAG: aspartyl/asparaginyl beta-hydroxylase domain-containing protein [Sphingomicrobium sp.]
MADGSMLAEAKADSAAQAGRFGEAAKHLEQAIAADPGSSAIWSKLSAMRRASGDLQGSLAAIDRALALKPLDFSFLLVRAMLVERTDPVGAGEAFAAAIAQLPAEEQVPKPMAAAVAHARTRAAEHAADSETRMAAALPDGLGDEERRRLSRFISNSSRRTRSFHQEPTHFHFPNLAEREFHAVERFAGFRQLAALTPVIRAEFDALLKAEAGGMVPYIQYPDRIPLRQWQELNHNRSWSAFHLLQNGRLIERHARHCPRTMAAIAQLDQPHVGGASPNLMFSLLAPHTRIPPHHGVANTRLVAHLPLIVPPECGFRCGASTVNWEVGTPFVFDDTIEHEAWNDSEELRVVMIFDLWAPDISIAEREAISRIIPASGVTAIDGL